MSSNQTSARGKTSEPQAEAPVDPRDEALNAAPHTLTEDLALALLKRNNLPVPVLEQLSKNGSVMKSRKVKLALAEHPRAPRPVSLSIVRHLYNFDLLHLALTPTALADIKKVAEETLINRLPTISAGEKLALARRASARVAGALLLDGDPRVIQVALENSRLTEALVVKALTAENSPAAFVHAVCRHPRWSTRREVRIAVLRHPNTPLACALEFSQPLPPALVREVLDASRLPANIKSLLFEEAARRTTSGPGAVGRWRRF
jgi:hypothetical protein